MSKLFWAAIPWLIVLILIFVSLRFIEYPLTFFRQPDTPIINNN